MNGFFSQKGPSTLIELNAKLESIILEYSA